MSLKAEIERAQAAKRERERHEAEGGLNLSPVVAQLHAQWMERPESEQVFTEAALKRGMEVLSNQHKVVRSNRFSGSGLDQCKRRQLFSFSGYPQAPINLDSADIMRSGTAAHFWIMLEGLSAGWLKEAEVFFKDDHYRLGGTLDGFLFDDSIWEYKSVASTVFNSVANTSKQYKEVTEGKKPGPKYEHELQCEGYELLTGQQLKSLFYQDRNFGQYIEYRLGPNAEIRANLIDLLEELNAHENDNTLPPMYDSCESRVGTTYKECPYRLVCPTRRKKGDTLYD